MAIGYPVSDQSQQYNSLYNVTLDLSGWDKTTIQVIAPVVGTTYIYGTNDAGALQGVDRDWETG